MSLFFETLPPLQCALNLPMHEHGMNGIELDRCTDAPYSVFENACH